MTYNNENAMMETKKDFILPAMVEDDCISVDVSEDYEGLRLSFPRVKIPGGGSLQFEIPSDDPENPDYTKYIEGVILYNHDTCAYWPEGSEYDDNVTPLCSSVDGKTGYGAPGGICATCALNQYGSVEKGKGKACKNMRNLYILRSGEHMPMLLSLPPTSLRPYSDFITAAFATRRRPIYSGVVQIGLKRVDNGSNTYSVATFRLVQRFEGNDLLQIKQYLIAAGIDAKHSNEDQIARFPEWVRRYGDRIGNFGGIDTDAVCRLSEAEMREYISDVVSQCRGHGGFAFGSGNSIPDYVPVEGYRTMVRILRELRGDDLRGAKYL